MNGREPIGSTWPYFGSRASRGALEMNDPVPVRSCWNGMRKCPIALQKLLIARCFKSTGTFANSFKVVMAADPFLDETNPLRFRALPESLAQTHLEGSERCLIHADNPLSSSLGVWINPSVRVGYSKSAYLAVNPEGSWPSAFQIWRGHWNSRLSRWLPWPRGGRSIRKRISAWKAEGKGRSEPGQFCVVDENKLPLVERRRHI